MAGIREVTILYGPCSLHYTLAHRPQKLAGLKERLMTLGYRVNLVPVKFENYCVIVHCGHEVFRCNIKNLMFNSPHYMDKVCQRAVDAVLDASTKFLRARDYLWFCCMMQGEMRKQSDGLREYYASRIQEVPGNLVTTDDCAKCCHILTTQNVII